MKNWHHPLRGLTRENFARELLAGITLLAIAVPLNIGYAQIAGLPATAGLYALVVPSLVYAFVVSSRQVVVSPDAAAAALVFSSLTALGVAGENFAAMAAAQAILCGVMLALASFLKLGFLANFLSAPILIGFIGGLALDILVSQVAKMLGVKIDSSAEFIEKCTELLTHLGETNLWALGMSAVSVVILVLGKRIVPVVPWALVVLVIASALTAWFGLDHRGVAVLGEVEAGPPKFELPRISIAAWISLIPSALALTLVMIAEGLLVSRSYAEKNGYRTRPDQDLLAFGSANLLSGLFSSFAVGSSTSRTAAMDDVNSRTQLPSLVTAAGTLVLLLFGTALLSSIPSPAIGAVVAVAVLGLLGIGELRRLWRRSRFEFAIGLVCFLSVLILGPLGGLLLAFALSLVNLARRASHPAIDLLVAGEENESILETRPGARESAPGVLLLRFAAPIFFANGAALADRIKVSVAGAPSPPVAVVLDLEAVSDVDVTGAEALLGAREWLAERGVQLAYTRVRPELRARFERFELLRGTTEYATNRAAVADLRR